MLSIQASRTRPPVSSLKKSRYRQDLNASNSAPAKNLVMDNNLCLSRSQSLLSEKSPDLGGSQSSWVSFDGNTPENMKSTTSGLEVTLDGDLFYSSTVAIGTSGSSEGSEDQEETDRKHDSIINPSWNWMNEPIDERVLSVVPITQPVNNRKIAQSHNMKSEKRTKKDAAVSLSPRKSRLRQKEKRLVPPSTTGGRLRMTGSCSGSESEKRGVRRRPRSRSIVRRPRSRSIVRRPRSRSIVRRPRSQSMSRTKPPSATKGLRDLRKPSRRSRSKSQRKSEHRVKTRRSHSAAPKEKCTNIGSLSKAARKPSRSRSCTVTARNNTRSKISATPNQRVPSPPLSPTTEILSPTNNETSRRECITPWSTSISLPSMSKEGHKMDPNNHHPESNSIPLNVTRVNSAAGIRTSSTITNPLRSGLTVSNNFSHSSSHLTNSNNTTSSSANLSLPHKIHTRNLLTTSVYHNEATDIWITTINMSQSSKVTKSNAAKYLKAFSFATEREARESAYANAPPKMIPFRDNPNCYICDGKFSVFRRASHCRNCGVCICSSCSTSWNKVSLPETYNIKNESYVKVCKSCMTLSNKFKKALLEGHYEEAQLLYNTGNVNLRCPFMNNVKGCEAMFPIHCAAEGGNLLLLIWLVDGHFCPIKRIHTENRNKSQGSDELITTSKGRTIVEIAMANQRVDILRYLVNEKNVSIYGVKDLQTSLKALEAILKAQAPLQEEIVNLQPSLQEISASLPSSERARRNNINDGLPSFNISGPHDDDDSTISASDSVQDADSEDDQSVATTVRDACIICYENSIDCVSTPCGHQICCLQCSKNMSTCPVCNVDCKFIRIFRP